MSAISQVSKAVEDFRTETNLLFQNAQQEPATNGDLYALAQQTYYALSAIEKAIAEISK